MSAADDREYEEEGVRAFRTLTESMDHVGQVLIRVEGTQQALVGDQQRAATRIIDAAKEAQRAAGTALQAATASRWPVASWAALGAVLGLLGGILGGYYLGRTSGWDAGQTAGYYAARDEQAAASWANTPGGRTARALEAAGSLTLLVTCTSPGWQIATRDGRRLCLPSVAPDRSQYGWFLP